MAKITKNFSFDLPLTKTLAGYWRKKINHVTDLQIRYIGYDYGFSDPVTGEERYDIDLEEVNYEGMNILPLIQADLLSDLKDEIEAAAFQNCQGKFEEQYSTL